MGIWSSGPAVFHEAEKIYWFVDGRYLKECYETAVEEWFGHKGELELYRMVAGTAHSII